MKPHGDESVETQGNNLHHFPVKEPDTQIYSQAASIDNKLNNFAQSTAFRGCRLRSLYDSHSKRKPPRKILVAINKYICLFNSNVIPTHAYLSKSNRNLSDSSVYRTYVYLSNSCVNRTTLCLFDSSVNWVYV